MPLPREPDCRFPPMGLQWAGLGHWPADDFGHVGTRNGVGSRQTCRLESWRCLNACKVHTEWYDGVTGPLVKFVCERKSQADKEPDGATIAAWPLVSAESKPSIKSSLRKIL